MKKGLLQEKIKYNLHLMGKMKTSYFLLLPWLILFTLFVVLPVISSIVLSFTSFDGFKAPSFIGFNNYIKLFFGDDIYLIALKNTLLFAIITGPISFLLCFFLAWIINEFKPKTRSILTLLMYAPSISGNAYIIWQIMFSSDSYGYINGLLLKWSFIKEPVSWLQDARYVLWIVIIVQLWLSLGTGFLSFISGLQTVDKSLYEAGAVDGIKNRWQELWFIVLPTMKPFLKFGAVLQITAAFAVSDVAINLAGFPSVNDAAHTIATHLSDYAFIRFELGYACTIATVLFLLMVFSNKAVNAFIKRVGE